MAPEYSGNTKNFGFPNTQNIYAQAPKTPDYVTVNHRGYIFAEQSGEYTFTFPSIDNIALLWVGTTAYYDYTRSNANLEQLYVAAGGQPVQYKATFTAGQYYPFRAMFGNGGGPGNFKLSIKGPDGKVILDDTTAVSPAIVQYSCDGVSAPKFPEFGAEGPAPTALSTTEGCPALDQQLRTVDGRLYKIFCGAYTTAGNEIRYDQRSFADCLKACSAEPTCQQIDFTGTGMSLCCFLCGRVC